MIKYQDKHFRLAHSGRFESGRKSMKNAFYLATVDADETLEAAVRELEFEDIEAMAGEIIFLRGVDYKRAGSVLELNNEDERIEARVRGSYDNSYHVHICKEDVDLLGSCSCPYDDVCKHIVAILLTVADNEGKREKEDASDGEDSDFLHYLSGLSKEELVELLNRFAPLQYRREVALRHASAAELSPVLAKLERDIDSLLNDEALLRDPGSFLDAAIRLLDELKIVVNKAPEKVFDIVIDLTKRIERAENEGYLYCESYDFYYSGDEYFDFDYYSERVATLINMVSDPEKQADAFYRYAIYCKRSDYFYLSYEKLEISERKLLLPYLDEIGTLALYDYISDLLPFERKESFLKRFEANKVFPILTTLYLEYGHKDKAIAYAESLLERSFKKEYAEFLIEAGTASPERIRDFVEKAVGEKCHWNNDFIIKYIDKCGSTETLEVLFENNCPHQFYDYLEKQKRIDEMHALLGRVPEKRLDFYRKYKKHYKDEAIVFFKQSINNELPQTGKTHYYAIAEHLKHLKALIPKTQFDTIVAKLKTEYKRRRNFVEILNNYFGDSGNSPVGTSAQKSLL